MLWSAVDASDKHCAVQNGTCGRKRQNQNQTCIFFLIKSGFFFLYNRCAKKGGPNRNKNKNTKCQITKKSYHCRRVLFEKWINVQYFWYSLQASIRTGKGFVLIEIIFIITLSIAQATQTRQRNPLNEFPQHFRFCVWFAFNHSNWKLYLNIKIYISQL